MPPCQHPCKPFYSQIGVEIWSHQPSCQSSTSGSWLCFILLLLIAVVPCRGATPKSAYTLAELQEQLREYTSQSKYAAAFWGIKVVSMENGKTLFDLNAHKLFLPASNTKLYTVSLALDRLGPDYRITTSIYAHNKPDESGTVSGDLIVYGRGDPSINPGMHKGSMDQALLPFVNAISDAKIKRITGDLIANSCYFQGPPVGSGWLLNDVQEPHGAEISAMSINDNLLQVQMTPGEQAGAPCQLTVLPSTAAPFLKVVNRTVTINKGAANVQVRRRFNETILDFSGQMALGDSARIEDVPLHKPPRLFAHLLSIALKDRGITIGGKISATAWPEQDAIRMDPTQWTELATVTSPPLRDLAKDTLKRSQNLYADLLLAHIGEKSRMQDGSLEATSEELGIRELEGFLSRAGISQSEVLFEEGSGLSRNNLSTPNATVALLQFMAHHSASNILFEALPVAGVDGTLQRRMKNSAAQGNVRAKTGTLNRDCSLSGQVTTAAGEQLLFSIILNRFNPVTAYSGAEVDAIAVMLAEFRGRSL